MANANSLRQNVLQLCHDSALHDLVPTSWHLPDIVFRWLIDTRPETISEWQLSCSIPPCRCGTKSGSRIHRVGGFPKADRGSGEVIMKFKLNSVLVIGFCLAASIAWADSLELKNGSLIEGKFLGGTESEITFQVGSSVQ